MNDMAIFALLNGIKYCSILHGIHESEIREWINNLDLDNEIFFIKVREYIISTTKRIGESSTAQKFNIPPEVLKIMLTEFSNNEIAINKKEQKNKIIDQYLKNISLENIAIRFGIRIEKINKWIADYNLTLSKKSKLGEDDIIKQESKLTLSKKSKLGEDNIIKQESEIFDIKIENIEFEEVKQDLNLPISVKEESILANQIKVVDGFKDEFDLIMEESIQ